MLISMSSAVLTNHIEMTPGVLGGQPRIAGTRIAVVDVVLCVVHAGVSVEEMPSYFARPLTLAQVHAALAFYYDNVQLIEDEIAGADEREAAYRKSNPEWFRD